jgi:hypothetical protein
MVRVDVKHLLPLVETVAGADGDAVGVLAADARFGHDERHELLLYAWWPWREAAWVNLLIAI